jgi:hypothetical protein
MLAADSNRYGELATDDLAVVTMVLPYEGIRFRQVARNDLQSHLPPSFRCQPPRR